MSPRGCSHRCQEVRATSNQELSLMLNHLTIIWLDDSTLVKKPSSLSKVVITFSE